MTIDADMTRTSNGIFRRPRLLRGIRRPPLLVHLVGFALIVLIPALLFSAFLIVQFSRQQEQIAAAQVNDTAQIISNTLDREIYGMMTSAKVLASSPFLDQSDLASFHRRTIAALRDNNSNAALVDPDMNVVLNTRQPFPPPAAKEAYTDAIERAFKTRIPQVSGVYFGPETGEFLFHVADPVIRNGKVVYVLVISRRTDNLGSIIADRNLPTDWSAIIKDQEGHRVFAALAENGKMQPWSEISYENPSIAETLGDRPSDDMIEASYLSQLTGWMTTVAVPSAVVTQPALRSWMLLAGAGLILMIFCIGLAVWFGRRIAVPILQLANQAEAIGRGEPALPVSTDVREIGRVSKVLAQASRERREAEEQNSLLMREMTHRAKNQYALIAAIARRAANESSDTKEFLETLSQALNSLARSADLLAGRGWDGAGLDELVSHQLAAFGAGGGEQISASGPSVRLNPAAAQTIGLALHELATNAAKYGALSREEGSVRIEWDLDKRFEMSWVERNGPKVVKPSRAGFGTLVTQKMTARGLGGEVRMDYAEAGVTWRLTAPRETVVAMEGTEAE